MLLCFGATFGLAQETPLVVPKLRTAHDYLRHGIDWNAQGKHEQAIAELAKAIELSPNTPVPFCVRANSLFKLGKIDLALADCNESIRLDPDFSAAYFNRGLIRSDIGQLEEAVKDFTETIRLDPSNSAAHQNRGNLFRKRREYEKAITDLNAAIRLDPKYSLAYYNRGIVWYDKREYEKAVTDYERALELGLNRSYVHNAIAWSKATCPKLSIRDGKAALKHAKIACKLAASRESAFLDTLAAAYAQADDFENAVATMEMAIELAPEDRHEEMKACLARYRLGKAYGTDQP